MSSIVWSHSISVSLWYLVLVGALIASQLQVVCSVLRAINEVVKMSFVVLTCHAHTV